MVDANVFWIKSSLLKCENLNIYTFADKISVMLASQVILAALIGYLVLLVVVGRLSARTASNALFFTAERGVAWYIAWPAMITAAMSGITFISLPGSVAQDGFTYLQMVLGFTVGQLLVAYWLVPLFYRMRLTSLYEYLAARFGRTSHRTGALFFFLSKYAASALKLYLVAAVLQLLLFERIGIPFGINALVCTAICWGYTMRGGVKSVLLTDWIKTLLLLAAVGVTIVVLLDRLDWSWATCWQALAESPHSRIFCFDDSASDRYFWRMFLAGIVLLIAMTGLDQDLMQRNLACRSIRDVQRNIVLTAISQAVVITLLLGLGFLLYAYAEQAGLELPTKSDELFPLVAVGGGLPMVVGALFVVGFAATSLSSVGSALTALTTSFSVDVMQGKSLDESRLLKLRKRTHGVMALLLFGAVLLLEYAADDSSINLIYRMAGYTYGPLLGMFLFGLWSRLEVRDRWVWLPALAAPCVMGVLQEYLRTRWQIEIGFELLIYNALLVMVGLWLLRRKPIA